MGPVRQFLGSPRERVMLNGLVCSVRKLMAANACRPFVSFCFLIKHTSSDPWKVTCTCENLQDLFFWQVKGCRDAVHV